MTSASCILLRSKQVARHEERGEEDIGFLFRAGAWTYTPDLCCLVPTGTPP